MLNHIAIAYGADLIHHNKKKGWLQTGLQEGFYYNNMLVETSSVKSWKVTVEAEGATKNGLKGKIGGGEKSENRGSRCWMTTSTCLALPFPLRAHFFPRDVQSWWCSSRGRETK